MNQQKHNIRSTKETVADEIKRIETEKCTNPPIEKEIINQIFFKLILIHKKNGTMYIDLSRKFLVRSVNKIKAVFFVYNWSSNCILATPIKDATNDTMVEAFKTNIKYLSSRGFKPVFNIMNNVA